MLNMPRLNPFQSQHSGRIRVFKPLRPRGAANRQLGCWRLTFRDKNDALPDSVNRLTQPGRGNRHCVEKDSVGVDAGDKLGKNLLIGPAFPPGARVPGVVIDEHLNVSLMSAGDHVSQGRQPTGHITVVVELITLVNAKPRVALPEDDCIIAAELAQPLIQDSIERVATGGDIIEAAVIHKGETAGERL